MRVLMPDNNWYDSVEEYYLSCYLEELKTAGFVKSFIGTESCKAIPLTSGLKNKYTEKIELKTKTKEVDKEQVILKPSIYTPDFLIEWSTKSEGLFYQLIGERKRIVTPFIAQVTVEQKIMSYVECKPVFDSQNMTRLFKNNQKFIWDKYKLYINLIFPIELFKKSFTPQPYFFTITGKKRKMTYQTITLNQLIQ